MSLSYVWPISFIYKKKKKQLISRISKKMTFLTKYNHDKLSVIALKLTKNTYCFILIFFQLIFFAFFNLSNIKKLRPVNFIIDIAYFSSKEEIPI